MKRNRAVLQSTRHCSKRALGIDTFIGQGKHAACGSKRGVQLRLSLWFHPVNRFSKQRLAFGEREGLCRSRLQRAAAERDGSRITSVDRSDNHSAAGNRNSLLGKESAVVGLGRTALSRSTKHQLVRSKRPAADRHRQIGNDDALIVVDGAARQRQFSVGVGLPFQRIIGRIGRGEKQFGIVVHVERRPGDLDAIAVDASIGLYVYRGAVEEQLIAALIAGNGSRNVGIPVCSDHVDRAAGEDHVVINVTVGLAGPQTAVVVQIDRTAGHREAVVAAERRRGAHGITGTRAGIGIFRSNDINFAAIDSDVIHVHTGQPVDIELAAAHHETSLACIG